MLSKRLSRVFSSTTLKVSILWHSAFFTVQLSHLYFTTGKTIALTIQASLSMLFFLIVFALCLCVKFWSHSISNLSLLLYLLWGTVITDLSYYCCKCSEHPLKTANCWGPGKATQNMTEWYIDYFELKLLKWPMQEIHSDPRFCLSERKKEMSPGKDAPPVSGGRRTSLSPQIGIWGQEAHINKPCYFLILLPRAHILFKFFTY